MKRLIFMFTLAFAIQAGAQQWSPVTNGISGTLIPGM